MLLYFIVQYSIDLFYHIFAFFIIKMRANDIVNTVKFLYKIQFFRFRDLFKKSKSFFTWQFGKHIVNTIDCFSDGYIFNDCVPFAHI